MNLGQMAEGGMRLLERGRWTAFAFAAPLTFPVVCGRVLLPGIAVIVGD